MKKSVIKTLVLLAIASPVLAKPGTYVSGEVGIVSLSVGTQNMFNPFNNPSGIDGRISVGHLWGECNLNYGIEGGASYFPNATLNTSPFPGLLSDQIKYNGYGIDLLAVLKYNLDCGLNMYAKGGLAYLHQEADEKISAFGITDEKSLSGDKFAPEVALGVGYQITPCLEADLTVSTVFAGKPNLPYGNPATTTNTILFGLAYNLG